MVFSSIPFLYYYLPVVLVCYLLAPSKLKNFVLFLASLIFYAWGGPRYVALMLASIFLGYLYGLRIAKQKEPRQAKGWLLVSCITSIALLGYFKYTDFFIENVNAVTGLHLKMLGLTLPIGISFYTFQILSYTIDVYRGTVKPQRSFLKFATYVSCFPQLIAGPIVRYQDIEDELGMRRSSTADVYLGLRRFVLGLSKKVLLANQFAALCDVFSNTIEKTVLFYWMNAIAFTLQIYFDFSGYSDMAIGLGRVFGFSFPENFKYPYGARSITEFWRRWHISLGGWFRDYVYIPLGGNRVVKWRAYFNVFVVWMLTGLWHGASWNFVLWGLFYAVLLVLEKAGFSKLLDVLPNVVRHVYVLFAVIIGFVLFQNTDLSTVLGSLRGMFGGANGWNEIAVYYLKSYGLLFFLGGAGCSSLPKNMVQQIRKYKMACLAFNIIEPITVCVLLLLVTAQLVDGSFNPFLYFRF